MAHQVTNCISSSILKAGPFTENIFYSWHFKPHFKMGRIFWARNGYRYRPDTELREILWRTLIYKHAWWKFSFRQFVVAEQKVLNEFYVASVSYSEISTYGKSTYNAVCDFPLATETIIALIRSEWLTVCVLYFWSCCASFFNLSLIERLKQRGPLGGARMGGAMEWHVSFSPCKILFFFSFLP